MFSQIINDSNSYIKLKLEIHMPKINWEISSSSLLLEFKCKTAWGHHVGEGKSVSWLESFQKMPNLQDNKAKYHCQGRQL